MKRGLLFAAAIAFALNFSACAKPQLGVSQEAMAAKTSVSAQGDFQKTLQEAQEHWKHREDKTEALAAIDAWERATKLDTGDLDRKTELAKVYTHIGQGYYWLSHGFAYFMDHGKERKAAMQGNFQKCMNATLFALALRNQKWNDAMKNKVKVADAVKYLQKADVPAAYWYATCAGKWATLEGIGALLGYKDKIFAIVSRAHALNPGYFYNATDRYFGVYYTKVPFMHPDLEKSREHFTSSIKAYPNYLETRVLYVEELLTKTGEAKLAKKQLEYVINADPSVNPNIYPENLIAQKHAQILLDTFSDYFD